MAAENKLLNFFKSAKYKQGMTRKEIGKILDLSPWAITAATRRLMEEGKIQRTGNTRSMEFVVLVPKERSSRNEEESELAIVKVAKIGESVREVATRKGATVEEVLSFLGMETNKYKIRLNGILVSPDTIVESNDIIVLSPAYPKLKPTLIQPIELFDQEMEADNDTVEIRGTSKALANFLKNMMK